VRERERVMRSNQTRLNTGRVMSVLGLGTYSYSNDREITQNAIKMALKVSTPPPPAPPPKIDVSFVL